MNPEIRANFPALERFAYLNSAAVAPLPTPAIEAINLQLRDVSMSGSTNFNEWVETKDRCRHLLGEMLRVPGDHVAFMRNTSDGLASIANGLKWSSGDNIVSFAGEFPSNFYPWRRIRDKFGVELRLASEREGRVDIDELISYIDANTKVVALSAVQFASGYRADLERVGRAARAVDALFCVDIIQALGAMPFDLGAQFVDAACGASHKWLCGPEGCGFIYLSDRACERVEPTTVGWISVESPWDFADREQQFKPTVLAWESGTGPASLFYGLEQSLKLLIDACPERIERHLATLSDQICDGLSGPDYEIVSARNAGESSQIVCVKHRGGQTSNQLAASLFARDVVVSPRGDRLRIAPHFFNDESDIERLLAAMP